jgi:hypothetical protein
VFLSNSYYRLPNPNQNCLINKIVNRRILFIRKKDYIYIKFNDILEMLNENSNI